MTNQGVGATAGFFGVIVAAPYLRVVGGFTFIILVARAAFVWLAAFVIRAVLSSGHRQCVQYRDNAYDWNAVQSPNHLGLGCSGGSSGSVHQQELRRRSHNDPLRCPPAG